MTIPNAEHLIDQALRLAQPRTVGVPRQTDLRRAISAAYYSVFHATSAAMADALVGRRHRASPRYALVYRGTDHRALRALCEIVQKSVLPPRYRPFAPASGFGDDLITFASLTIDLQIARHEADYDPRPRFKTLQAIAARDMARTAIAHWATAPHRERTAFLTLLAFPPR